MKRRVLLHVALPLLLGGALYLGARADGIALFHWVDALGLGRTLDAIRLVTRPLALALPRVILGSAPDAAWAYAFGAAIALVWMNEARSRGARAWLAVGMIVTVSLELAQLGHFIPGVFDPIDLLAMAGGYALGARHLARSV